MVNNEVLQKRIEKSKEYIDFLEGIKEEYTKSEFINNKMVYGSTERFLHLTIESLLDIGNHIISDENLGSVDSYRDIPEILYKNEYINEELKEVFIKIVGFRNILVHDYLDIDKQIVYKIINEDIIDLKKLFKIYVSLL